MPPSGGPQQGGGDGGFQLPPFGDDGSDSGGPEGGWEVSNETGDETGGTGGRQGQNGEDSEAGAPDGEEGAGAEPVGSASGGPSQVDVLERALGELDGEILDERIATTAGQSAPSTVTGEAPGNDVPAPPRAEPELAQAPGAPLPPDRPDARDDDVVARQLREAAMAATDPELAEKLWEEYRRYKDGL